MLDGAPYDLDVEADPGETRCLPGFGEHEHMLHSLRHGHRRRGEEESHRDEGGALSEDHVASERLAAEGDRGLGLTLAPAESAHHRQAGDLPDGTARKYRWTHDPAINGVLASHFERQRGVWVSVGES